MEISFKIVCYPRCFYTCIYYVLYCIVYAFICIIFTQINQIEKKENKAVELLENVNEFPKTAKLPAIYF